MIAVLYHGPGCADGFAAAWVFSKKVIGDVDYLPINYGDDVFSKYPNILGYTVIYILDFSFKKDILLTLAESARVIVLDHHKTAQKELEGLVLSNGGEIHFDMNRSGAKMTWDYLNKTDTPLLVQYVQDRDLWTWKLPHSEEVSAALTLQELDFDSWTLFSERLENPHSCKGIITVGEAILKYRDRNIDRIIGQARFGELQGYPIVKVNSPIHESEIGNKLCKMYPECKFAAIFYITKEGDYKYSLRSIGDFDVSAIAKECGGGGHKNAAGFTTKGMV